MPMPDAAAPESCPRHEKERRSVQIIMKAMWARSPRRFIGLILAIAAIPCFGCAKNRYRPPVLVRASTDFHCPDDRIAINQRRRGEFIAAGCGRSAVYQCHQWDGNCDSLTEFARQRGARYLQCPPSDLEVGEVHPHLFQVTGCGASGVYFCEMRGAVTTCVTENALQRR